MSRHTVKHEGHEVVVGWDPPLRTFFGQVYRIPEQDDDPIVWVGASPPWLRSISDLRLALGSWWVAALDEALTAQLEDDKRENRA